MKRVFFSPLALILFFLATDCGVQPKQKETELNVEGDGYVLDNKIVPFEKRKVSLDILQDDGSVRRDTFEFKYSEHGPVVSEKGNKAWALRIAGLTNSNMFEQYHKMGKARNLDEFESALRMLQIP